MLPSMPVLFTRESQDGFFSKIEPSTSFLSHNPVVAPLVIAPKKEPLMVVQNDTREKADKQQEPPKNNVNALETALVRSYYKKVQSRFVANTNVPTNKFVQFQNILKSFDPLKETPELLYRRIEQLFGEEHKDIVEEFLLFLKPGQAAAVGRFMDHFMLTQMTGFIDLLQSTFARKPTVLRKVLRALTTGINTGSSDEMKRRVLPHLRSSTRLTLMFKSLFPDERPPDSLYENATDVINESFLTADKGCDVWEFEDEQGSRRKLDATEKLDTAYLHGRVFLQHGRILRAAQVTFPYSKEPFRVHARRLAPAHCHLSPPSSEDDERTSPKRNNKNTTKIPPKRTKKVRSPTKTVKDVNDNTKLKEPIVINSPKGTKGKSQNKKGSKDKKDSESKIDTVGQKREKKEKQDNKGLTVERSERSKAKQVKVETTVVEAKKIEVKKNSWTREEDKTMLQVLKGEAGSDQVFGRIRELLPHRSVTEIKARVCEVMNLLQQMAVGEVT